MKQTFIADTANVVAKRKSDGHIIFTAVTQLAGLESTIQSETIYGGIGNKALYKIRSQKQVNLNFRNATFNLDYLSMTQGVKVEADTVNVTEVEKALTVVDNAGTLEVTITGTPISSTVSVINASGDTDEAAVATGVVTIPAGHAVAGEEVDVVYKKSVNGNVLEISADKFSENFELEYHTIEYSTEDNNIVKDIYFVFDNVVPSGDFSMSLENGSAYTPEISLEAMADPNTNVIGRIVEVPRP